MRYSVERHATKPISVNGLMLKQLPITRQGATEFTFSRFLVPYLSGFTGYSMFADEDMVVRGDVHELFDYVKSQAESELYDVWVMQDQERFEWPSVMLFNNKRLQHMTPEFVQDEKNSLFDFSWAGAIGNLPHEWNHCVGMMPSRLDAKLYHWTQGIPYWPECRGFHEDKYWFEEYESMVKSVKWVELHHNTKHFKPVMKRMLETQYGVKIG